MQTWLVQHDHICRPPDVTVAPPRASFRGNKTALPSKPCVVCGLAMSWRRRWAKNWADVKYCSQACRRKGVGCD
ncbi:MAG: DUF2256 domain-containing protein [Proteobacteria bacterium]|nr:DUF2256 domain-containing protein [Pseudomonadota bacterium]